MSRASSARQMTAAHEATVVGCMYLPFHQSHPDKHLAP
jgi:hypothetical protein